MVKRKKEIHVALTSSLGMGTKEHRDLVSHVFWI